MSTETTTSATVRIHYTLSQDGQRAALLAGQDGSCGQHVDVPATADLLQLAEISSGGGASIDLHQLVRAPRKAYANAVTDRDGTGALSGAKNTGRLDPLDAPLTPDEATQLALEHLRPDVAAIEAEEQRRVAEALAEATADAEASARRYLAGEVAFDRVRHAYLLPDDLRTQVEARRAEEERQIEARRAERKAEQAEQAERRRATLAAVVARHLPDCVEAWEAGELCEREPVAVVTGSIRDAADDLPGGDMPEHTGTMSDTDADCLPADAVRVRAQVRAQVDHLRAQVAEGLGIDVQDVTVEEQTPEWVTLYRPATEDERDDQDVEIDRDGDVRLGRVLRLPLGVDAGGVSERVYRVLTTR